MSDQTQYTTPLYRVDGWLNRNDFNYSMEALLCKETKNMFIFPQYRSLMKGMIMIPQSGRSAYPNHYHYFIYCREDEQQKALDILKKTIIDRVGSFKNNWTRFLSTYQRQMRKDRHRDSTV